MQKDYHLLLDVLFYFVLPIFCWEIGREFLPDYIAMIISTLPGIFYSFFRLKSNSLNFTRKLLLMNILAGLFIDLLSGSALRLLWNNAYFSLGLSCMYLISCFLNKPLFLYFSLDILVEQGYDRCLTREILFEKKALKILNTLTLINGIREFIYALLLMKLISKYGVEIYSLSILIDQLFSFFMSGVTIIVFIYLYKLLNEMVSVYKVDRHARKRWSVHWLHYHFERCYFFICNHH